MINHTFVICAYKESPYLEACIRSLKAQKHKSAIMIYTSTPNALISGLAEKYDLPLVIGDGKGIGSDWNQALKQITTEYATIAHQDDVYFSSYSEEILAAMEKQPQSIIGFSDYVEIVGGSVIPQNINLKIKKILLQPIRMAKNSRLFRRLSLSLGSAICCPAVTYHWSRLKDFEFDPDWKVDLDWEAWERLSRQTGAFCYVPEKLMGHRIHEASETTNCIENNVRTQEDLKMLERFWPKKIARLIMRFYVKSQKTNQV